MTRRPEVARTLAAVGVLLVASLAPSGALAPSRASADGIEIPPLTCPRGSEVDADHAGAYCAPVACGEHDACRVAQSCAEVALCVEEVDRSRYGRPAHRVTIVHSECAPDGRCAAGRCERARRCVPAAAPSCACAAPGRRASARAGWGAHGVASMFLVALAALRHRSRARPDASAPPPR